MAATAGTAEFTGPAGGDGPLRAVPEFLTDLTEEG